MCFNLTSWWLIIASAFLKWGKISQLWYSSTHFLHLRASRTELWMPMCTGRSQTYAHHEIEFKRAFTNPIPRAPHNVRRGCTCMFDFWYPGLCGNAGQHARLQTCTDSGGRTWKMHGIINGGTYGSEIRLSLNVGAQRKFGSTGCGFT